MSQFSFGNRKTYKRFIVLGVSFFYFHCPSILFAAEFDGVHIKNEDSCDYIVKYKEWRLTTAICDIKKPTKPIRRGLISAFDRAPLLQGFKILSAKNSQTLGGAEKEITARISAHTNIFCICVNDCRIEIENISAVEAKSGQTLLIKDGKVKISR